MWTPLQDVPAFAQQFAQRYRRTAKVQRTIEYSTTPEGKPVSILRSKAILTVEGKTFELEDVLKEPDGLTDYCLVREYGDSARTNLKSEHKFRSCQDAEIYVVEQLP